MIDREFIKQHYCSLSDKELMQFAIAERKNITSEALAVLRSVFTERNLQFPDLPGRNEIAEKQDAQAKEQLKLGNELWLHALQLRKDGSSDEDVKKVLLNKGLSQYKVEKLMERLPAAGYTDEAFDKLIRSSAENASLGTLFAMLILVGLLFFVLNSAMELPIFFVPAVGIAIAIVYFLRKFKGDFKGGYYWQTVLFEEPERIVWIKPITEKHTVALVITLFKIGKFQFLTSDGLQKTITCDSDENRSLFFRGIKQCVPHAHIGYSERVDAIYKDDPATFLLALQRANLYEPVSDIIKISH